MEHPNFVDPARFAHLSVPPATERAWAAGFFDGEGHCQAAEGKYLIINVVQTETSTLERFRAAIGGHGNIYPRSLNHPEHWTPGYCIQVGALAEVEHAVLLMWEFLSGPKRQQITEAFEKRAAYRSTWPADFRHPLQRLSDEQVGEVRLLLAAGGRSQRSIADEYGVSQYLISKIKTGKRRR